jgi:hypothetical protein
MLKDFFATLGRIYTFIMSVVLAVILGAAIWVCWGFYEEEQLQNEFTKVGKLVSVPVVQANQQQKSWRDILSNSTYLTVRYNGKDYPIRFVMDSVFVGSGDDVSLLYHPRYDAFRQPNSGVHFNRSTLKSRLIDWSTVSTFSNENRLLLLCLVLTTASFFVITGVLVTILPLTFLQDIARIVLVIVLCIACIFFTYDSWKYYEYYQTLKRNGHPVTVQVLDTQRISHRRSSRSSTGWYEYHARIRYQQQERIIPISSDDFDALKPPDSLQAYYDESMNDFMSVDFPPDYIRLFIPLFFGFLVFMLMRNGIFKKETGKLAGR